jgi:hypothetical protein
LNFLTLNDIHTPTANKNPSGVDIRRQPLFRFLIPRIVVRKAIHSFEITQRASGISPPNSVAVAKVVS